MQTYFARNFFLCFCLFVFIYVNVSGKILIVKLYVCQSMCTQQYMYRKLLQCLLRHHLKLSTVGHNQNLISDQLLAENKWHILMQFSFNSWNEWSFSCLFFLLLWFFIMEVVHQFLGRQILYVSDCLQFPCQLGIHIPATRVHLMCAVFSCV